MAWRIPTVPIISLLKVEENRNLCTFCPIKVNGGRNITSVRVGEMHDQSDH